MTWRGGRDGLGRHEIGAGDRRELASVEAGGAGAPGSAAAWPGGRRHRRPRLRGTAMRALDHAGVSAVAMIVARARVCVAMVNPRNAGVLSAGMAMSLTSSACTGM